MSSIQLVAVVPRQNDEFEYFVDINADTEIYPDNVYTATAEEAVKRSGVTRVENGPKRVSVCIYRLRIEDGCQIRRLVWTVPVDLPVRKLTQAEYIDKRDWLFAGIPKPFHVWLTKIVQKQIHEGNYDEALLTLHRVVSGLREAIVDYTNKLHLNDDVRW